MIARVALALLLALPAAGEDARPAPTRQGLSWPESESLARKLASIEERQRQQSRKPQSVLVTEAELNSYLNLGYAPQMPKGVSDVEVRLNYERIHATGVVDLERVKGKVPPQAPWSPLSFLSGRVPVEMAGRFLNEDGFGTIEWESVRLASIPVPISLLEELVSSSTRSAKNPEGFDIHAPFRLPYSVNRVRLEPGRAFLDF